MSDGKKPRLIGINHVAIEVGDIDEALDWYGKIFDFNLRGRSERSAFIDMGDHRIEVIEYSNIQFTKAPHVLRGMGLDLDKNASAKKELAEKGMAPE